MSSTQTPHRPLRYARSQRARFVKELKDFVRIPSISAQPKQARAVKQAAEWLASHLRRLKPDRVKVVPTARHPIVYAAWRPERAYRTMLVYGHYDVQPVDPLDQWRTPPFEPAVRENSIHGRGASDDKGQLFTHVKAIESYCRTAGGPPLNVICLFEGEEEIGSPHLVQFIRRHRRALAADVAVLSDTRMLGPDRPVLTYALRGALRMELAVRGTGKDLHSGQFGGAVPNAAQALCEIVARLYDSDGRVSVPGFYDGIRPWSVEERAQWARYGPRDADVLRDAGARPGYGERGFTVFERTTIRPALNVNGISGGYQGAGSKSVIPARAVAKLGIRLAADQKPAAIARRLREYIARITPGTVTATTRVLYAADPVVLNREDAAVRAAMRAYRRGFGAAPAMLPSGGTIPVVDHFQKLLGIPTLLMGFALPDDNMHAPNEKFPLDSFHNGIATSIWLMAEFGRSRAPGRARRTSVACG